MQAGPKRAMKILYRHVDDPCSILEKQSMRIEELRLPGQILSQLKSYLQLNSQFLPVSARKIQDWDAGLLER